MNKVQRFCHTMTFERHDDGTRHNFASYVYQGTGYTIELTRGRYNWSAAAVYFVEGQGLQRVEPKFSSTGNGALCWLFQQNAVLRSFMAKDGWVFFPDGSPEQESEVFIASARDLLDNQQGDPGRVTAAGTSDSSTSDVITTPAPASNHVTQAACEQHEMLWSKIRKQQAKYHEIEADLYISPAEKHALLELLLDDMEWIMSDIRELENEFPGLVE